MPLSIRDVMMPNTVDNISIKSSQYDIYCNILRKKNTWEKCFIYNYSHPSLKHAQKKFYKIS